MKVRIGVELFGAGLVRHILLETRNDGLLAVHYGQ